MHSKIWYLLGLSLWCGILPAQQSFWLDLTGATAAPGTRRALARARDSASAAAVLGRWVADAHQSGHLEARADLRCRDSLACQATLHLGPYYAYDYLRLDGLNDLYRQRAGIDRLLRQPLHWPTLESGLRYCLDFYQNQGYPFAAFRQLDLHYRRPHADTVLAGVQYIFDPGRAVRIDSIYLRGNPRERAAFIYALGRVAPGDLYNQRRIADLPRVLNNSPYYEKVSPPEVRFSSPEKAVLTVALQRKRAGKLDVLLGILPPDENAQELQITGTMDILLVSSLRLGEQIGLRYNKLTSTSLQTEVKAVFPYLLGTPVKLEGELELLKQEESFLNTQYRIGAEYVFAPFLSARFFYRNRDSRLLDDVLADTSALVQVDSRLDLGGAGLVYDRIDDPFNPSRGLYAAVDAALGQRVIRRNPRLPEVLYTGLPTRQPSSELSLELRWYHSPVPRHVVHLANRSYWLVMDTYFRNDQQQLGGGRSIRGFNENTLFADRYTFFTAEYRFQLERTSYLFLFADLAWLSDRVNQRQDWPAGLGLGMNYSTQAGIISITYAVGRSEGIPFQPARGKIHIGFINQF
ncbi:MAG: hypothetical protein OHK0039_08490 [Bacteroidia bacterium]